MRTRYLLTVLMCVSMQSVVFAEGGACAGIAIGEVSKYICPKNDGNTYPLGCCKMYEETVSGRFLFSQQKRTTLAVCRELGRTDGFETRFLKDNRSLRFCKAFESPTAEFED